MMMFFYTIKSTTDYMILQADFHPYNNEVKWDAMKHGIQNSGSGINKCQNNRISNFIFCYNNISLQKAILQYVTGFQ